MRRELDDTLLDALECAIKANLGIGGREVEELGIAPCSEIQEVQCSLLTQV